MGQAAGTAAAFAVAGDVAPSAVDIDALRTRLSDGGALL
jgi:hypothetical protein